MSSIGSIGSASSIASLQYTSRRPDPAKLAEELFDKLDTAGQGYLQKADFEAAFDSLSSSTSGTSSNVDSLFSQLDADSDGKVTKAEFSDTLTKLSEQLEAQFQSSRMDNAMSAMGGPGGMGGLPPPPPPNDAGFTKDELSSQLEEIGSSDSERSSLISSIVENFEAADTNGDGKVSFQEAMAYDQSSTASSSAASSASVSGNAASAQDSDAQLMLQIMRLVQAYGQGNEAKAAAFSVTA